MEMKSPVVAEGKFPPMSSQYSFIQTSTVMEEFDRSGWYPFRMGITKPKNQEREGFQKHLVRFRKGHESKGELVPEILLLNSHDGTSSFKIMAGIYRVVCENGLVVAESVFTSHTIRHTGYRDEEVRIAILDAEESVPRIMRGIKSLKMVRLGEEMQMAYGREALVIKYGKEKAVGYLPERIVAPRRRKDEDPTLWNLYNRVQENIMKGGEFKIGRKGGVIKTRKIGGIKEDIRVNQALWELTMGFLEEIR
jgi:hypothetical protein